MAAASAESTRQPGGDAVDALRQLVEVARPDDVPMLTELLRRLEDDRLRILVVGEAKRGKSTLVNDLLDTTIMPTGVVPVTALAATVVYGEPSRVDVQFADQTLEVPVTELSDYITEKANPNNRRGVAGVTVHLPAALLKDGVELVDTPGTGSVHEHNTREAETAFRDIDVGVLVLTADAPMSAAERDLLSRMVERHVRLFCVLNKVDYLSGDDLKTAMEFVSEQVSAITGADDPLFLCAARDPEDEGVRALRAAIETHLRQGRRSAQLGTVAYQASQVARATAADLDVTAQVLALHERSDDERVGLFSERLARISERAGSAGRIVDALAAEVLAQLNREAERAGHDVRRVLDERLTALYEGELAQASAAETEERAHEEALALLRPWLDGWREEAADLVLAGVEGIAARLTADLADDIADLKEAAKELLGVNLDLAEITIEVPEDQRFFYTLQPVPMQTELVAGAVRRRLPGAVGRRHSQAYIRQEMGGIAEAQVGRIRADLQQRLNETSRQLRRDVQRQQQDSIARLAAAVSAAESVHRGTQDEVTAAMAELEHRRAVLSRVLGVLSATST